MAINWNVDHHNAEEFYDEITTLIHGYHISNLVHKNLVF